MSLKAEITLEWGDDEYLFALKGAEIEELQHQCGKVGFGVIFERVNLGGWFWSDIYHIIRLGLIGGGMGAVDAKRKVDFYMGASPVPLARGPDNPLLVAKSILAATMVGVGDLEPGEGKPGESPAGSTSPNTAPPSSNSA
jgi:hypothetical protein